jgi:hypothetical protein
VYEEQVHVSSQSDLLHALADTLQSLLDRGPGAGNLADDEEVLPVDLTRVGPDRFADLPFVVVLLSRVEGQVTLFERMVDGSWLEDPAGPEDVSWSLGAMSNGALDCTPETPPCSPVHRPGA